MTRIRKQRRTARTGATVDARGGLAPSPSRASGPGRRALKRIDKRERIRAAALELFTRRGFRQTSTKAIAERAGIAAGTLFLYADDKQDLLFLVFHDRLQAVIDERFDSLPASSLEVQLMHIFRGLFAMYGEHPEIAAQFIAAFPGARGRNAKALDALTFGFLNRVAGLVREAQVQKHIDRGVDPHVAAQNIFSLYFGALIVWVNHLVSLDAALDPLLVNALALQFRGLLPRSTRR